MWWWPSEGSGSGLESGSGTFDNMTVSDPQENSTVSCAARSIQGPILYPYHEILVAFIRVCENILVFLACISGVFLNGLIVILVLKHKKLQKIHFKIAAQFAALNALISIDLFPAIITAIAYHWVFGEHVCSMIGASFLCLAMAKVLVLLIFVIDRFLSVFMPYGYPKHQKAFLAILFFGTWSISILAMVIGYVLDCYEFVSYLFLCYLNASCSKTCTLFLGIVDAVIYIPANIIPVILYIILFVKAWKVKKAMAREDKNDWNAIITFFLVFVTTFALALPNIVTVLAAQTIFPHDKALPAPFFVWLVASTRLVFFTPSIEAIFILRNKDFKEVIKEVTAKLSQRKNRSTVCVPINRSTVHVPPVDQSTVHGPSVQNEAVELQELGK